MKKKAERVEEKREKRPYAVAKYLRISPYKVRTVLDLIRGRSVEEAEAILSNITNGGALPTKKVLMSTIRAWTEAICTLPSAMRTAEHP